MADWYYHDGGTGHVGPVDEDGLRAALTAGRLGPQTLVWREGMAAWEPLHSRTELTALHHAPQPPPLPATPPARLAAPGHATPAYASAAHAAPAAAVGARPRAGMSVWMIVLLAVVLPLLVVVGILAAIAVPAYQQYVKRADVMQAVVPASGLRADVKGWHAEHGRCPTSGDLATQQAQAMSASAKLSRVEIGPDADGDCAIALTLSGIGTPVDGGTINYWLDISESGLWGCYSHDLDTRYLPLDCQG